MTMLIKAVLVVEEEVLNFTPGPDGVFEITSPSPSELPEIRKKWIDTVKDNLATSKKHHVLPSGQKAVEGKTGPHLVVCEFQDKTYAARWFKHLGRGDGETELKVFVLAADPSNSADVQAAEELLAQFNTAAAEETPIVLSLSKQQHVYEVQLSLSIKNGPDAGAEFGDASAQDFGD